MKTTRRKLLDDYIIPALDSGRYENKLFWVDKKRGIFRIYWSHKNAANWQCEDTIVFQEWDRIKGHFKPEVRNYFMSAKQRFRAALYKLSSYVKPLPNTKKLYRDYQLLTVGDGKQKEILAVGDRKQRENLPKAKSKVNKRIRRAIPTSVICKNTSYVAKKISDKTASPVNSAFHTLDDEIVIAQYSTSMEKLNQLKRSRKYEDMIQEETIQKKNREVHEISVLRENSSTSRIPHIPPQPVPVYSAYKQFYSHNQTIHECPEIFVSPIYSGPENMPKGMDDAQSSMFNIHEDACSGNVHVLNLSMKSDVKLLHQGDRRTT